MPLVRLKLGIGAALLVPCLTTLALGCAARRADTPDDEPAEEPVAVDAPIVHGAADKGRHPAVVALVSLDGGLCTGTLVGPNLVLTAHHCVAELPSPYLECPASGPQVGRLRPATSFFVYTGDEAARGPAAAQGARLHVPPGDVLCGADVALLELDRPLTGIAPVRLASASSVTRITAVGFGQIGDRGRAGLRRYRAHVPVVSMTNHELVVGESTCSGDSGGPALDEASGGLVGVLSRGGPTCDGTGNRNVYTRLDPWIDWLASRGVLRPLEPVTGEGSAAAGSDVGEPCTDGASCSGGVCVSAATSGYCSRRCGGGGPRCPKGYRCRPIAGGEGSACSKK